jgi:hypothetical protein
MRGYGFFFVGFFSGCYGFVVYSEDSMCCGMGSLHFELTDWTVTCL